METPKSLSKPRITRNPTPRLSERKKSLFSDGEVKVAGNMLEGIELLESSNTIREISSITTRSKRNIEKLLDSNRKSSAISFLNDAPIDFAKSMCTSPLRRSLRTKSVKNTLKNTALIIPGDKENTPNSDQEDGSEEQLQKMFKTSMRLTSSGTPEIVNKSTIFRSEPKKRHFVVTEENVELSPYKKNPKIDLNDEAPATISTSKFYSRSRPTTLSVDVPKNLQVQIKSPPITNKNNSPRSRGRRSFGQININKGVKHKIRRPIRSVISGEKNIRNTVSSVDIDLILKNLRNENLKNRIASKREERQNIEKIHNIFRSCKNPIEMARPLTVISGIDDTNNNKTDYVLPTDKNDQELEMSEDIDTDFSDIDSNFDDYEELSNAEEIIPIISHESATIEAAIIENESVISTAPTKRKFFKSARSSLTPKEIHITNNIRASICNGKLSLIQEEKKVKRRPKRRPSTTYDISDEQATVKAILKNLDDTAYGDMDEDSMSTITNQTINDQEILANHSLQTPNTQLSTEFDYLEFRRRLPYNTSDPSLIEQQYLLLDFLINNNMCTEENFTIFIADPDNHKEEAAKIVDQVFVLVNQQDYFRQRLPYNTDDPEVEAQQHRMLDFLVENNICTEENFDIFIANYNQRRKEADEIMETIRKQEREGVPLNTSQEVDNEVKIPNNISENSKILDNARIGASVQQSVDESPLPFTQSIDGDKDKLFPIFDTNTWKPLEQISKRDFSRTLNLDRATNQYQIDAGQRNFGAHQCKQCGLVYSIHEVEEEKLHNDYHASLHLLRFKGWIDEDIVAIYPEWGSDGRILRITESSHTRRHERLADILKIVDKELGFASYVIPPTFVAYLAVRKHQIVGLCLVVPLEKANKYIKIEELDCCTEEEFPAKCGISRIWVSPLHRRLHIATKLINAVQQNTIFGEEIPLDMIAFSAPTEAGRKLAQKVTQIDNFLVYQ
ncbi:PREDICTED: N-acetyltransferase eco [Bactrocera latifrons]|uniref:N-acetyltransferase eco n=1 Tax=Bactrocera latifrons TaxID=174628 RepID=A0A0K8W6M7_BACLA|nr:PREDICTED: N-acetyltransferase eco [Bactrocera latifrons]